ncbi:MAG TPA: ornithine cyclodeaminase family protein [Candidatus Eisenbacteria bacterium]|nr:ornithine cyclodeaminase family protein [Candidatus Eisenbacteria bacterium]
MRRAVFIGESAVARSIDPDTAFRLAREAFRLMASGDARMPPKTYLNLPTGDDFRAMPAYFRRKGGGEGACGLKWISVYPGNRRYGLPTVNGTLFLNSFRTGELLAVIEANTLTALRTAGASALATRHLCVPRPKRLAIVGAGIQAGFQLRAMAALYRFESIRVWGFLPGEAERFCRPLRRRFGKTLRPAAAVEECVEGADLVVTCTSSRRPLVKKSWIKKGAHINAIGADAKGKQELDPALVHASTIVVDEWEQASHSGEINVPVTRGLFSKKDLHAELAEIVSGKKPGRTRPDEITIFDSTGVAVLDVVFARYVFDARRGTR